MRFGTHHNKSGKLLPKCLVCEQWLKAEDQIELHYIKPKQLGGSDAKSNFIALHKQCHKQVTFCSNEQKRVAPYQIQRIACAI